MHFNLFYNIYRHITPEYILDAKIPHFIALLILENIVGLQIVVRLVWQIEISSSYCRFL